MSDREVSRKETCQKIRRATSGKEISEAMIAHFKKFAPDPKEILAKPNPIDELVDYLGKPLDETVKAPLFQRY